MKRTCNALAAMVVLAACADSPTSIGAFPESGAMSATPVTTQVNLPFSMNLWVSCANDGAGETVQLSGHLQTNTVMLDDGSGGQHYTTSVRPDGVKGVGLTTNLKYRGTGGTTLHEYDGSGGTAQSTMVNNFRIIGQGAGNNLLIHATIHMTLDGNGELSASLNLSASDCR